MSHPALGVAPPLPSPRRHALFLDIDGTLLPFAERPKTVVVARGTPALLASLERAFGGAFALVSGRPVEDIDRLFAPHRFVCAGEHGAEIRGSDGERRAGTPLAGERVEELRALCRALAARDPRLLLEEKTHGWSLHYRGAPERERELRALFRDALASSSAPPFDLVEGTLVLEFVPRSVDKGTAIRRLLEQEPFRKRRPVFVGDDTNDEPGFAAAERLGGLAVKVGTGPSVARHRLRDPDAVLDWLREIVAATRTSAHA